MKTHGLTARFEGKGTEKAVTGIQLQPATVDLEARTIEGVLYNGATVPRGGLWSDPYELRLSLEDGAVDLTRVENGGAPVLNSHSDYSALDVVGTLLPGSVRVEKQQDGARRLVGTLKFSEAPDVEPIWSRVSTGILRNLSVRAAIRKLRITQREAQVDLHEALEWELQEVSVTPIGADPGAQTLSQERHMETKHAPTAEPKAAPDATPAKLDPEALRLEGAKLEAERRAEIDQALAILPEAERAKLREELHADPKIGADEARRRVIGRAAELDSKATHRPQIEPGTSAEEKFGTQAENLILSRAFPQAVQLEAGRGIQGLSMESLARRYLRAAGVAGLDAMDQGELFATALTTYAGGGRRAHALKYQAPADFPNLLANVLEKSLRMGYDAEEKTYQQIAERTEFNNFRAKHFILVGEMEDFEEVPAGGEYQFSPLSDSREQVAPRKYGKRVGVTWETLINDELGGMAQALNSFGIMAAALEGDLVFGILLDNAAMADGEDLFSAAHNNIASGADLDVPSVPTVGAARAALRSQTMLGSGRKIRQRLGWIVVPDALLLDTQLEFGQYAVASQVTTGVPLELAGLKILGCDRIDDSATPDAWYAGVNPGRGDGLVYGYLRGEGGLRVERRQAFEIDGLEVKARLVFGCGVKDYRGLYMNPGTGG